MTDAALRLVDGSPEPSVDASDDGSESKVFARSITAPPGAPWDQLRVARLEARVGAPLPLGEVVFQLRRLEAWRPGRAARFAAFYIRSSDIVGSLSTRAFVDGRWMAVSFTSKREREARARRVGLALAALGGGLLVLLAAGAVAISARQAAEGQLADLERLANAKAHLARTTALQLQQARALAAAGVRGRSLYDLLTDLDWASSTKAPGARVQALHWQGGVMAIEARGDSPPVNDVARPVTKVGAAIRPGVWLWGVARSRSVVPPGASSAGAGE